MVVESRTAPSLFGDLESCCDFGVGQSSSEHLQDIALSLSQRRECTPCPAWSGPSNEILDQPPRDAWSDQRVAARRGSDAGEEKFVADVFEHESARTGSDRLVDELVAIEGGEHHPFTGRFLLRFSAPNARP